MVAHPITVVAAGALRGSDQGARFDWSYGAWLLATGPADTRLDAITWVATGAKDFVRRVSHHGGNPLR